MKTTAYWAATILGPASFVIGGFLALVALLASLVPAYRASRLDPSEVPRAG